MNGKIVGKGTHDELMKNHVKFIRRLLILNLSKEELSHSNERRRQGPRGPMGRGMRW